MDVVAEITPHPSPELSLDARVAEGEAIPRAPLWRVCLRALAVLSILAWFGLRRVVGALTGSMTGPVALRRAFEALGPIYIKLGQLIASGDVPAGKLVTHRLPLQQAMEAFALAGRGEALKAVITPSSLLSS